MLLGVERWRKPVAQRSYNLCGMEDQASKADWGLRGGSVSWAGGVPLDKFCFGNGKFNI